jgi:hypothetical protein
MLSNRYDSAWALVEHVIDHTRTLLLYGPPGTGKTYAAHGGSAMSPAVEAAETAETSRPVYSVTLTADTPAAELRGHYVPMGGEFIWRDGPVIRAWREGARLIVNEIDHAGSDALSFLLVALDNPETARLTLPNGETVRPAREFSCVATMNGDPAADLPEALRDRFPVRVEIDTPHPKGVDSLPEDLRDAARGTVTAQEPERRITLRAWLAFAALRVRADEECAALAVFGRERAADVLQSLRLAAGRA